MHKLLNTFLILVQYDDIIKNLSHVTTMHHIVTECILGSRNDARTDDLDFLSNVNVSVHHTNN